jgi:hypothetical protein
VKRVIERAKPKNPIIEPMVRDYFNNNPKCEKAVISISADKATRSTKQNRLYWLYLGVVETETGQPTKDTFEDGHWVKGLHTQFKYDYLPKQFYDDGAIRLPSTKSLKVAEFKAYLERIDSEMGLMGIMMPHPEDLYYEAMGIPAPKYGN